MLRRVWGQGPEINPRGPGPTVGSAGFYFRLEYACARPEYAGGVGKPGQKKNLLAQPFPRACRILFWQSFVQTYLVHAYSCSFAVFSPSLAGSIIIPACRAKRRRGSGCNSCAACGGK